MIQSVAHQKRTRTKSPEKPPLDLEEVILKCWPQINFRVRKSIGYKDSNWEDIASDILMNTLVAIREGKYKGKSSIETFIYTITTRRIIDYIRKKYRTLKSIPEQGRPPDPFEYVKQKEGDDLLARHLRALKPKHADMLYLYYYLELSRNEIADIYGITLQRVSEILTEAKKSLRLIIQTQ
jgi:RNA polymerase sigma factor (sigma-70 family)